MAGFPTTVTSTVVYGNDKTINKVQLTVTDSGNIAYAVGVSNVNDGTGITWENILPDAEKTISASGKWLYWKAVGYPGSTISNLQVEILQET